VSFPGYGHIRPALGVVEELVRRGHRVTYLAAPRFAELAAGAGAEVVTYPSVFPEPAPPDVVRVTIEFIRESFAPLKPALARFDADVPDLFVHDALSSDTAAILGRKYGGVPKVRLFPGFGGNEHVPLNGSQARPRTQPPAPDHPELAALGGELGTLLRSLDVEKYAQDGLASGNDAEHNLVFVPAAFQPSADKFDERFVFAGPCLREKDLDAEWSPGDQDAPVVLVSLGTSAPRSPEFFRTCAKAFAGQSWRVVMTLGSSVDPARLGELPPNVTAHRWLPHLAVLRHAKVLVCQAGTGSVMEALYRGVPLVVIPRSPDSFAIAERVVELGLGRALDAGALTPAALNAMVREVAADRGILAKVTEFGKAVRACGGVRLAADVLEGHLRP
jgi:MGT family glycosyltransferase